MDEKIQGLNGESWVMECNGKAWSITQYGGCTAPSGHENSRIELEVGLLRLRLGEEGGKEMHEGSHGGCTHENGGCDPSIPGLRWAHESGGCGLGILPGLLWNASKLQIHGLVFLLLRFLLIINCLLLGRLDTRSIVASVSSSWLRCLIVARVVGRRLCRRRGLRRRVLLLSSLFLSGLDALQILLEIPLQTLQRVVLCDALGHIVLDLLLLAGMPGFELVFRGALRSRCWCFLALLGVLSILLVLLGISVHEVLRDVDTCILGEGIPHRHVLVLVFRRVLLLEGLLPLLRIRGVLDVGDIVTCVLVDVLLIITVFGAVPSLLHVLLVVSCILVDVLLVIEATILRCPR